jgi:hypothetical protein
MEKIGIFPIRFDFLRFPASYNETNQHDPGPAP